MPNATYRWGPHFTGPRPLLNELLQTFASNFQLVLVSEAAARIYVNDCFGSADCEILSADQFKHPVFSADFLTKTTKQEIYMMWAFIFDVINTRC